MRYSTVGSAGTTRPIVNAGTSRFSSLCVRRFAHQFHFRLKHADTLFRFCPGQFRAESFRLVGIKSQLAKQAGLFGRHACNGVELLFAHTSTISFARNGSALHHLGSAGRRISVIGSVTSTIAATTVRAVGMPTASPRTP